MRRPTRQQTRWLTTVTRIPCPASGYTSGFTDSVALLLVGLVRSDADVEAVDVSPLICMRVQTAQQAGKQRRI